MKQQNLSSANITQTKKNGVFYHIIALSCGALLLASCAASVPQEQAQDVGVTAPAPVAAPEESPQIEQAPLSENEALINEIDEALEAFDSSNDNQSDDEIGSIIWDIEQGDNQTAAPKEIVTFDELIPEGQDPSLEAEALDAAFAMLRAPEDDVARLSVQAFEFGEKAKGVKRIGVFVPLSGPRAVYGAQVSEGIEMALFQINDPRIELLYFDSADEAMLAPIVKDGVEAGIDIAIGPLFSTQAKAAYPYFAAANIPVLSLSNNETIARSGLWVLGLVPEQQIDALLAEAVLKGHDEIAILSDLSAYGRAMTTHVTNRLKEFGISVANVMVVDGNVGADDAGLVTSLKRFTHYKPLGEGALIQDTPPPYDSVILAGGADFVLKVAPLLSYYDLGPDRVSYLGTDLWASAGLLGEPSLQGAFIATINPDLRKAFAARYKDLYSADDQSGKTASFLSQLGFDAMAVASSATITSQEAQKSDNDEAGDDEVGDNKTGDNNIGTLQAPIIQRLLSEAGFKGYTGAFRLLANGRNNRTYSLFEIQEGGLIPAAMEPKTF